MGRVTHYDTVQMMAHLLSQRENVAKYWVTVTAGQRHTISMLGVSAATIVDWGDGLSNEYTGTATRTHVYASAGTYAVKIYTPENVITFDLRDGAAVSVLNSADLKGMLNINNLMLFNMSTSGLFNSSDFIEWETASFNLWNLHNITGRFDSSDIINLNAVKFRLLSCSNLEFSADTRDFAGWTNVEIFAISGLKASSITISQSSIKNWSALTELQLHIGNLTQLQANLVLWECYQIARTRTGGEINLAFAGNAAPSGTFQACQSSSVSSSTPGKEIAYELLNDSLDVGFNKWTTVSTN